MSGDQHNGGNGRFALIFAGVVTVSWSVAFVADLTIHGYDAPPTLHALMMLVAGWAFGQGYIDRKKNGNA